MIVEAACIEVGRYNDLKAVTPELLRKCNTYLMRKLRCRFSRCKALVCMEGYCSVFLAEAFLHSIKLVLCKGRGAVYCRHEDSSLGFVFVCRILYDICKCLPVALRKACLLNVACIA